DFPDDAEARLAALTARVEAAGAVADRLHEERSEKERARALLAATLDQRLIYLADRVEEAHGRLELHKMHLEEMVAARIEQENASRLLYYVFLALGACIAFASGWLISRGEVAGGLMALFTTLFATLFLVYRRVTRHERLTARVTKLEQDVADW